jgi:hypothetical protein
MSYMLSGSTFIYDNETHATIGIKFMNGEEMYFADLVTSSIFYDIFTPVEGDTIQIRQTAQSGMIILDPATNLNNLTINFPADSTTRIGQRLTIISMKQVSNVNWTGATFMNSTDMLDTNDAFDIRKTKSNVWVRIQ